MTERKNWDKYIYCENCYSVVSKFDECLCLVNNEEDQQEVIWPQESG